jgi:DNA-binding Lrp family transcriptional regulator
MVKEVLKLLLEGQALQTAQMAAVLGATPAEIEAALATLREQQVLLGWRPVLNPAAIADDEVQALIEVSVVPERDGGFNRIAERIARFDQVQTCYLMSGGYDLLVTVRGKNLLSVATFVAEKLATLESVQSTATRFMLRSYKVDGYLISATPLDGERLQVTP